MADADQEQAAEPVPKIKRLADAQDSIKQAIQQCNGGLQNLLLPLSHTIEASTFLLLQQRIQEELSALERTHLQAVEMFLEREVSVAKAALKTQADKYALKLETARTAGSMRLKNQAVEMEAVAAKKLEEAITDISTGGASELAVARLRQEELTNMVNFQRVRADNAEELLQKAQKQLDQVQNRAEHWRRDLDAARASSQESKRLLSEALVGMGRPAETSQPVAELARQLAAAAMVAKAAISKSEGHANSLMSERDRAVAELRSERQAAEGRAAAARGLAASEAEVERERAALKAEHLRLLLERKLMRREFVSAEGLLEPAASHGRLGVRILGAELAGLEEGLAAARAMAGGDEAMRAHIGALQQEISLSKRALADALKDLNITVDKNKTLTQTIHELVQGFEASRTELEGLRQAKESEGGALREAQGRILALQQELRSVGKQLAAQQLNGAQLGMLRSAFDGVGALHANAIATIRHALQSSQRASLPTAYPDASPREPVASHAPAASVPPPRPAPGARSCHPGLQPRCAEAGAGHGAGTQRAPPPSMTCQIMGAGPFPEGTAPPPSPSPSPSPFGTANASNSSAPAPTRPSGIPPPFGAFDESAFDQEDEAGPDAAHGANELELLASAAQRSGLELTELAGSLVSRLGSVGSSLQRMQREVDHVTRALENAHFEVERVTDGAREQIRTIKQQSKEERARLVRVALESLQQLRSHLTYALSGLRLVTPMEQHMAHEGFAFRMKRSRWGVVARTGETAIVRLDGEIVDPLQHVLRPPTSVTLAPPNVRPQSARAPAQDPLRGGAQDPLGEGDPRVGPAPPPSPRPATATPRTPVAAARPTPAADAPSHILGPSPRTAIVPSSAPMRVGAFSFGLGCAPRPSSATVGEFRGYHHMEAQLAGSDGRGARASCLAGPAAVAGGGGGSVGGGGDRSALAVRSSQVDPTWLSAAVTQTKQHESRLGGESLLLGGPSVPPPVSKLTSVQQRIRKERSSTGPGIVPGGADPPTPRSVVSPPWVGGAPG